MAVQEVVPLYVNGKAAGSAVLATNGRVCVPVRLVAQNLGATVNWNAPKQQVVIVSVSDTIVLSLGSKSAVVNGAKRNFDSALVVMLNGSAHVGLRDVGTLLGTAVRWDSGGQAVYVGR